MSHRVDVLDEAGRKLGTLVLDDGLTQEEVEEQVAIARRNAMAQRAAKEAARLTPITDRARCPGCGEVFPAVDVGLHVPDCVRVRTGIDVGDGS